MDYNQIEALLSLVIFINFFSAIILIIIGYFAFKLYCYFFDETQYGIAIVGKVYENGIEKWKVQTLQLEYTSVSEVLYDMGERGWMLVEFHLTPNTGYCVYQKRKDASYHKQINEAMTKWSNKKDE